MVIDTVLCLTLAKWETVSGQFGGYLTEDQAAELRFLANRLQRVHPVSVDRAREHADPHPYMDKAPGLSRPNRMRRVLRFKLSIDPSI